MLRILICVVIAGASWNITRAVDVSSSAEAGGPAATALAQEIVDPSSLYTLDTGSVSTTIGGSTTSSSARQLASFSSGNTPNGTLLPLANQDPANPTAVYAGGIFLESGICLCTGCVSDNDPIEGASSGTAFGIGAQGPNNGLPLDSSGVGTDGEVSKDFNTPSDADFVAEFGAGGDAAVLEFEIVLDNPGFLRIRYVHATDEYPQYVLANFNDSFAAFIKNPRCLAPQFENFVKFVDNTGGTPILKPLSVQELLTCGLLRGNNPALYPAVLQSSPHANVGTTNHYDHEYGGFSVPLIAETQEALAPGRWTLKLVVQDVGDNNLDSATFIESESLILFDLAHGDYNMDGVVDSADYSVWASNFGTNPATFDQGDGNGDCVVNLADYTIWRDNLGATGNGDFAADFNRDGVVNLADYTIWRDNLGMPHCASRYQGDADGDGDVDSDDYQIWIDQFGSGGGGSALLAASSGSFDDLTTAMLTASLAKNRLRQTGAAIKSATSIAARAIIPDNPDLNGDGTFDEEDRAQFDAIILRVE